MNRPEPWQPMRRCLIGTHDLIDETAYLVFTPGDLSMVCATSALIADTCMIDVMDSVINGEPEAK